MIASHPRLKEHSQFLFIPGPDDAGILVDFPVFLLPIFLHLAFEYFVFGLFRSINSAS